MRGRHLVSSVALLAAVGGTGLAAAVPASAATASVTVSPHSHLTNGESVTVTASGFTGKTDVLLTVEQCSAPFATSGSAADCDELSSPTTITPTSGAGSATFSILEGASYSDLDGGACDTTHACVIVVTAGLPIAPTTGVDYATAGVSFVPKSVATHKPKHVTHTTVTSGKKTVKAGHRIRFTARTGHSAGKAKLTGRVVFRDNGKKFAAVTEHANGVVHAKHKIHRGRNVITAEYRGSSHYKASHGRKTVHGTKQ
jgi:hypothetical protein